MRVALFLVLVALLVPTVRASQTIAGQPPPAPADLVATARIPLLEVRVTAADGTLPAVRVFVNWRSVADGRSGGGAADRTGRFMLTPLLQSTSTGWRVTPVGPHRIEVVADGFKTWVADSVDLQAGRTHRLDVVLELRGPTVLLEPAAYARLATEHVLKSMRGLNGSTGRVEVLGPPVLLPEHARAAAIDPRSTPEAFVLAATYVDGKFREPVIVSFSDERPNLRVSYTGSPGFLPLDEPEWKEMAAAISDFYAVAADVSRGPERFDAYLPENMRRMLDLRGEKNRLFLTPDAVRTLSADQLRRFVALAFDAATLSAWAQLHGLRGAAPALRPPDIRRDPNAVIASLEVSVKEARRALEAAGALSVERLAGSQMYVRRLLGEGYMVREDPDRDGIRDLSRDARLYTVLLGGPLPHVVLDRGKLRIVAVDLF